MRREKQMIAAGRARGVEVWRANVLRPDWGDLASALSRVEPPTHGGPTRRDRRVPARLRHLFWDVDSSALEAKGNGPFIALRLLRLLDLEGLAWGTANLRPSDWQKARQARGLSPAVRALAANLAGDEG